MAESTKPTTPFFEKLSKSDNVRYLPYILVLPILLFQVLSLSGCAAMSPGLPGLYIVSFSHNTPSPGSPELWLGYFGLCSGTNGTASRCASSIYTPAESLLPALFPPVGSNSSTAGPGFASSDSGKLLALISAAKTLQDQTFVPVVAGAGVFFGLAVVLFVAWPHAKAKEPEDTATRQKYLRRAAVANLALSVALDLAACLATRQAANALRSAVVGGTLGKDDWMVAQGRALQVLQWFAFSLTLLFATGVPLLTRALVRKKSIPTEMDHSDANHTHSTHTDNEPQKNDPQEE